MKKTLIKDFPFGVLVLVISLFLAYPAYALAGRPSLLEWIGIVLSVMVSQKVFSFGYELIKGIEIDAKM